MPVERLFHWTCTGCGRRETKLGYGLPKGWCWNQQGAPVVHFCPSCQRNEPKSPATLRLVAEIIGTSPDDLEIILKEIIKDVKAGYLVNVGAKGGSSYTYKTYTIPIENELRTKGASAEGAGVSGGG